MTIPETPSEIDDVDAKFWLAEIKAAQDRRESWYKSAEVAIARYEDGDQRPFGALNIFWANVETQKSALDDDFGKPQVSRINQSKKAALTRHVSMVLEQTLDAAVRDTNDNHEIECAVHDVLMPGAGQVWLELNPMVDDTGNVVRVDAPLVHVGYKEYLEGPATREGDIPWKARLHLFTLDDLKDMLALPDGTFRIDPASIPRNYSLPMPKDDKGGAKDGKEQFQRAAVWEIWAKFPQKRRIYVAEDFATAIKIDADPYRLKAFFPCPRAMMANVSTNRQIPRTDYSRYADQASEIDRISQRIFVLTEVLKHNGVYDQAFGELANIAAAGDNKLLPIENWAELITKGGLAAVVQYTDLQPIIAVLAQLHQQRSELINLTYEITGISDLARGMTNPNETLGAQKLKKSFGSGRFKARHRDSRRFAKEAYALKGELIAEHFPRDQIQEMSGIQLPTVAERHAARQRVQSMGQMLQQMQQAGQQPPFTEDRISDLQEIAGARFTWEDVAAVLRSDSRRCYMVDVETDQNEFRDEEADKASRIEFTSVVNQLMQQFGPMIAANPAHGEVFKKLIMFALSSFRSGRSMEEGIETAIDAAIQQAASGQGQQQQQQPDPVQAAQAALIQAQTQKAQLDVQTAQQMGMIKMQEAQAALEIKKVELQLKQQELQLKAAGQQLDLDARATKAAIDTQLKVAKLQPSPSQQMPTGAFPA